jgi:chemotaxis family two-component system response regulator Rcp1
MNKRHKSARLIEILAVEDNPADIRYLSEVFSECRLANRVTAARDGETALRCMRGEGEFQETLRPDLVLLDLNMPGMDGKAVLAEIRADPRIADIPVIVLTTSSSLDDVSSSYGLKANSYMVKPPDAGQLLRVGMCLENMGLGLVALPKVKKRKDKAAK